jgi:GT2 family glycosyltransferase
LIDVIILNRNLGEVCDALVEKLNSFLIQGVDRVIVVDSGSESSLKSRYTSVGLSDELTHQQGLRFGRGMNLGLQYRESLGAKNPWILLLPVDTEIIEWDLHNVIGNLKSQDRIAALKPASQKSEYLKILDGSSLKFGWNFEEGAWLINSNFVSYVQNSLETADFFDEYNFRGYLTSLDLAFRAYVNGFGIALTSGLIVYENETYLLDKASLIRTEPLDENQKLMVSEGLNWLRQKYQIQDVWDFAQLVRLCFDQFLIENPEFINESIIEFSDSEDDDLS